MSEASHFTQLPRADLSTRGLPQQWAAPRSLVLLVLVACGYAPMLFAHGQVLWSREHYQFFPLLLGGVVVLFWLRRDEFMHAHGVMHRDIKPENILVGENGVVKLADLGVSVAVDDIGQMTATGHVVGTWDYMSPEHRTRLPIDERSDQFALAVVAYEMLTKKRPFGRFKAPSQLNCGRTNSSQNLDCPARCCLSHSYFSWLDWRSIPRCSRRFPRCSHPVHGC
ncbi:MAG: protein kinase [Planctomycetota bacterium]|nr:protein kinase [Planctomycetota bacterium]